MQFCIDIRIQHFPRHRWLANFTESKSKFCLLLNIFQNLSYSLKLCWFNLKSDQMDIRGDVFGLLAAHPLTPLLSLHHLDLVHPIFPNMSSKKALEHLYEAAKYDPHRIVQQTVCYDRWFSWTVSVSWGYAVQVFGRHVPLSDTLRAQETFEPYKKGNHLHTLYNFDTREHHSDTCRRPTIFFMDKVYSSRDGIKSTYRKMIPDNCTVDAGSPRKLDEIRVFSHKYDPDIKEVFIITFYYIVRTKIY